MAYLLGYFASYLAMVVASAIAVAWCLIAIWRRELPTLARIGLSVLATLPFVWISWPLIGARLLFDCECRSAGLVVGEPAVAAADGYELAVRDGTWYPATKHPYFGRAVQDVLDGRIRFFEVPTFHGNVDRLRMGSDVDRYYLAERASSQCVENDLQFDTGVARFAGGRCLAAEHETTPTSRWVLTGYDRQSGDRDLAVIERASGKRAAWFRSFRFRGFPLGGPTQCPAKSEDYAAGERLAQLLFTAPARDATEVPSSCVAPSLPGNYELHRVETYEGQEPIAASLDAEPRHVTKRVQVVVNRPDRDVVLWLSAYDPVVWDVGLTPETRVAMVVTRGYHGQAVIGLPTSTPVFIATHAYSPGANCSESEITRVQMQALGARTLKFSSEQKSYRTLSVVVGDPVYDPAALVRSEGRRLSDHTMATAQ